RRDRLRARVAVPRRRPPCRDPGRAAALRRAFPRLLSRGPRAGRAPHRPRRRRGRAAHPLCYELGVYPAGARPRHPPARRPLSRHPARRDPRLRHARIAFQLQQQGYYGPMSIILLVILALIVALFIGLGFVIKWLFIIAVIAALIWLIGFFLRGRSA